MPKQVSKGKRAKKNVRKLAPSKKMSPASAVSKPLDDTPPPRQPKRIASIWRLTKQSATMLGHHWRLFGGITAMYGLLNVLLAQGTAGGDASALKAQLGQALSGHVGGLAGGILSFSGLLGATSSSTNGSASAYQFFLSLLASLAIIWALRQVAAGKVVRIRDAYYLGMAPLVPFVLVLLVIGLQLLPLAIGSSVYAIVVAQGIAVHLYEKVLWVVLFVSLASWSLYMVSSSLFSLYIVTLPGMTPLKALRSARQLVRGWRWQVIRKLLFLPLLLLTITVVVMLPFVLLLTPLANTIFYVLSTLALVAVHSYIYALYRELLDE